MPDKVTALVIGDPHFKVTEMAASLEMAKAILTIAQQTKPDFIVCLGDTLDRHETIHVNPLSGAVQWLAELSNIAKVYLLIGNHDRPNNSDFLSDLHPFVALRWWDNEKIVVVDKVVISEINGLSFFFVPYVPPGRFIEALSTHPEWSLEKKDWSAGFCHQEFYGTTLAPLITSKNGDKWGLDYPLLINGHIHDRDLPQKNIISVGTPRQHDFDESPDKSLSLFTFTVGKEGEKTYHEERISLPLPKKISYRLTVDEFRHWSPPSTDDYVKVNIYGTRGELVLLREADKVKQLRRRGIKIVTTMVDEDKKKNYPLPEKEWREKPFRQRLEQRVKEDVELNKIYLRIFTKQEEGEETEQQQQQQQPKKVKIKKRK